MDVRGTATRSLVAEGVEAPAPRVAAIEERPVTIQAPDLRGFQADVRRWTNAELRTMARRLVNLATLVPGELEILHRGMLWEVAAEWGQRWPHAPLRVTGGSIEDGQLETATSETS